MKFSALAAGAALTALLLAGCGGDNGSPVGAALGSTTTARSATSATSASGGSVTTESSSSDPSSDTTPPTFEGNSNSDFCNAARDLQTSDLGSTLSGAEGDLEADLQKIDDAVSELTDKAPSEIKDDINTFGEGITKLKEFYAKYDYDQAKILEAAQSDPQVLAEATAGFTDANFEAALSRITAYSSQVCGITDDSTDTTG